jgi:hypothetical protein
MELFCPHCSQRVAVPDDKAGQVMSCPLCTKQFMAPALAPPPMPVPALPPVTSVTASEPKREPVAPEPAAAPMPPGDYSHVLTLPLRVSWLAFVPPACMLLLFVSSFFTWHLPIPNAADPDIGVPAMSLWTLGFSKDGQAQFLAYIVFTLLCGMMTFAALPFDKGWIPAPAPIAPLMMWKNLLVAVVLGLPFLFLCYDYLSANFLQPINPIGVAMKIAFRLHFLAILASFGLFWLHLRQRRNLPAPKVEVHW